MIPTNSQGTKLFLRSTLLCLSIYGRSNLPCGDVIFSFLKNRKRNVYVAADISLEEWKKNFWCCFVLLFRWPIFISSGNNDVRCGRINFRVAQGRCQKYGKGGMKNKKWHLVTYLAFKSGHFSFWTLLFIESVKIDTLRDRKNACARKTCIKYSLRV